MFEFFRKLFLPQEALNKILADANQKAREIVLKANEDAVKVRQQAEIDNRRITAEAIQAEKELNKTRSQFGQEKAEVLKERQLVEEDKKRIVLAQQNTEALKKRTRGKERVHAHQT
jgi:tRNA A22 N-methylase